MPYDQFHIPNGAFCFLLPSLNWILAGSQEAKCAHNPTLIPHGGKICSNHSFSEMWGYKTKIGNTGPLKTVHLFANSSPASACHNLEYCMLLRFMWSHHGQKLVGSLRWCSTIIKYLSLIFVVAHYSTAVCSCLSVQQISGLSPHHIPPSAQKA